MNEPTQDTTPIEKTPSIAPLADLLEWAQRRGADVLILSGKGRGGLVVHRPGEDGGDSILVPVIVRSQQAMPE